MKNSLLIQFLILLSNLNYSQRFYTLNDDDNYIDSLRQVIAETKSDSVKCINLFKLADLFRRNTEQELSDAYLKEANSLSNHFKFLSDLSVYYNAANCLKKGDYNGYARELQTANDKLKKYNTRIAYSYRAFILKNIAVLQQMNNSEKEATRIIINEAIPIAKKSGDYEVMSIIYNTLAIIFMNNDNREKAHVYFTMAIQCAEKVETGSYQLLEMKLHAYIKNAENATQLNKIANARESLDKAYAVLKNYPESNINGIFYQAKGLLDYGQSRFNEAIVSYDLGIKNAVRYHDELVLNNLKFVKSQALNKLKRYVEARDLLIDMAEKDNQNIDDAKKCYKQIILNCDQIGDIKNAYKYSLKYMVLADSIYEINSKKEITELEARYNAVEKEKEIHQLETQRQKALLVSEKNKFNYRLFGLLSVILLLAVIFLWRNAITQKKLAAEKEKNYIQNINVLKTQKEIDVMQAAIKGEEEERKRVARDLHDGVGSSLSILKMRLSGFTGNGGHGGDTVESLVFSLNNSINELRQVAYNLIPETIIKLGLKHALQDLCFNLKTQEVSIAFQSNEINEDIIESDKINIFRIVQELVNNALKHSRCTEIVLDCSQNGNLFLIAMEDNGIGFDMKKINTFEGIGLKNLENRVNLLRGKLQMDSDIGSGTAFNIELFVKLKNG